MGEIAAQKNTWNVLRAMCVGAGSLHRMCRRRRWNHLRRHPRRLMHHMCSNSMDGWGPAGDWQYLDVPGGYLAWSKNSRNLDAHCTLHGPSCKTDRTLKANARNRGQGRPLGRHLLWLALGNDPSMVRSREDHMRLKLEIGPVAWHARRCRERQTFESQAPDNHLIAAMLADERPRHADEADNEPSVAP